MKFIARILVIGVVVFFLPFFMPGIAVEGWGAALSVSVLLALVNLFIKPLIIILTLPLTILTLGLFGLVVNALMFFLVAALVPGFEIESLIYGFVAALIVSVANWLVSKI